MPHRTFTAVEGAEFSAALASRGILEVEARPRSRWCDDDSSDAAAVRRMAVALRPRDADAAAPAGAETPGAQELGEHRFEFAVAIFAAATSTGNLLPTGTRLHLAARVFAGRRDDREAGDSLLGCNNSRVIFSTARP